MENIVLVGGGGHCISCIDVIESSGRFRIVGIVDVPEKVGQRVLTYSIIGDDQQMLCDNPLSRTALVTVGQISTPQLRKDLYERLTANDINLPVIVASSARCSPHTAIGRGTIVMHMAMLNAGTTVGNNCIINTGALIEHNVSVGSHCHISTNACVNGNCRIDDEVFVGSNATLFNGVHLVSGIVIGAGSVVRNSIDEAGTYVGNPIRRVS